MMSGFVRGRKGRVLGVFSSLEADLLRSLVSQVIELVRDQAPERQPPGDPMESLLDFAGPVAAPDDPVLARLFPNAYSGDEEAAGEFRRFTERGLRDQKADQGLQVIADLEEAGLESGADDDGSDPIELDLSRDQAQSWLRCLTDVRLALATRLGVQQGDDEFWDALPEDDPRAYMHDVYDWLGYVQESLVHAQG
ncbi:MAG: DUF2017 domain-containing protein [Nocardioidaceae bacterium]